MTPFTPKAPGTVRHRDDRHRGQNSSAMCRTLDGMLETSARLLRLLSLLQTHRDWPGPELADRLGVTTRTLRRDVDKLRGLGYPVHAAPGVAGGYRLGAGAQLPPLLLDDEEAVAVAVSLRTAAGGSVEGITESSIRALMKLEQVLPARLRGRVQALQSVTVSLRGPNPSAVDPDVLMAVANACRDHQCLRFDYRDHDGVRTTRRTEPHTLIHTGWRWYLLAWDVDRAAWRNFRLDRLTPKTPTGPRFTPREPPSDDVRSFASWSVSTAAYRYQALARFHAPAEELARLTPPTSVQIEPEGGGTCLVRTGANSLDALAVHLTLIGVDFDILGPPELVDRAQRLATRLGHAVNQQAAPPEPGPTTEPSPSPSRPSLRSRPPASGLTSMPGVKTVLDTITAPDDTPDERTRPAAQPAGTPSSTPPPTQPAATVPLPDTPPSLRP